MLTCYALFWNPEKHHPSTIIFRFHVNLPGGSNSPCSCCSDRKWVKLEALAFVSSQWYTWLVPSWRICTRKSWILGNFRKSSRGLQLKRHFFKKIPRDVTESLQLQVEWRHSTSGMYTSPSKLKLPWEHFFRNLRSERKLQWGGEIWWGDLELPTPNMVITGL